MSTSQPSIVKEYADIYRLATNILEEKHQIVDLDCRRNKTREALRELKRSHKGPSNSELEKRGDSTFLCLGNTFLKLDSSVCERILEKDRATLDEEVTRLREELKSKVAQLHKMEGTAELKGFELKGMRIEEMSSITDTNMNS